MKLPIGLWAQLACVWEATAPKPGNIHPGRDFEDLTYIDLLHSAAAMAPILDEAHRTPVGQTILRGVRAMRRVCRSNAHLGTLLLLAPLAAVPANVDLRSGVAKILNDLDVADSRAVYEAIRLAQPAGLGQVADQDIADELTLPLKQIMALAADRDLVARQYVTDFREILDEGVLSLCNSLEVSRALQPDGETRSTRRAGAPDLRTAIVRLHLQFMSRHPDTLIARKRGLAEAEEAARRAEAVLASGWPHTAGGQAALAELDAWLRGPGHARNPGTTADLVAASLFATLRQGIIRP